jgi:hypothetical protein
MHPSKSFSETSNRRKSKSPDRLRSSNIPGPEHCAHASQPSPLMRGTRISYGPADLVSDGQHASKTIVGRMGRMAQHGGKRYNGPEATQE